MTNLGYNREDSNLIPGGSEMDGTLYPTKQQLIRYIKDIKHLRSH
jgi:hypothetical protein